MGDSASLIRVRNSNQGACRTYVASGMLGLLVANRFARTGIPVGNTGQTVYEPYGSEFWTWMFIL